MVYQPCKTHSSTYRSAIKSTELGGHPGLMGGQWRLTLNAPTACESYARLGRWEREGKEGAERNNGKEKHNSGGMSRVLETQG